MRRLLWLAFFITAAAHAQYGRYQTCQLQTAMGQAVSGAQVYFLTQPADTTNLTPQAQVYSSATGGAVSQPILTNGFGECTAYLTPGVYTVVYVSQYTGKLVYPDQNIAVGGGSGSSVTLQTNGTNNGSQSLLNLVQGSNITLSNSGGNTTIAATESAPCTDCVLTDPTATQTITQPAGTSLAFRTPAFYLDATNGNEIIDTDGTNSGFGVPVIGANTGIAGDTTTIRGTTKVILANGTSPSTFLEGDWNSGSPTMTLSAFQIKLNGGISEYTSPGSGIVTLAYPSTESNLVMDAAATNGTVHLPTLPSLSPIQLAPLVTIKRMDSSTNANTVTILPGSGGNIDGNSSISLSNLQSVTLMAYPQSGNNQAWISIGQSGFGTSINSVAGNLAFTGAGVSQSGSTFTFSAGSTFPGTNGIVYNTSTTASRNATSSDVNALFTSSALTPTTIQANGTNCAIEWQDSSAVIRKIELFACSAVTDYANASQAGSLEWAIVQLGTSGGASNNGGTVIMHPGIYPIAETVLIDYDWITIQGSDLPYWSGTGSSWPAHQIPGTPGGAQLVSAGAYPTFTIGNTTANMHGDTRHKGILLSRLYAYGDYITGTSFIADATPTQHDDNMRIEDSIIQGMTSCAIVEEWDYHDIFRNTIQSNAGDSICEAGGYYSTIAYNIIYDNGGEGVTISGGVNTKITDNSFGDLTSIGTLSGGSGVVTDNVVGTVSGTTLSVTGGQWQTQQSYPTGNQDVDTFTGGSHVFSTGNSGFALTTLEALAPNMPSSGSTNSIMVGQDTQTNDGAQVGFLYGGSMSPNNFGYLSLNGLSTPALEWTAGGYVGIGYEGPPGYSAGAPPNPLSVVSSVNTPLSISSPNTCCTQFTMTNTSSGTSMNFFVNGTTSAGWGGVYDNGTNSNPIAYRGGTGGGIGTFSGGIFGWTSNGTRSDTGFDTGLSRTAAGAVAVGNGTAADTSGTLTSAKIITSVLNQKSADQYATALAISSSTTGTFTFPAAYTSAPVCTVSPRSALGTTTYSYSVSTTNVVITLSLSGSDTFDIICVGNPN